MLHVKTEDLEGRRVEALYTLKSIDKPYYDRRFGNWHPYDPKELVLIEAYVLDDKQWKEISKDELERSVPNLDHDIQNAWDELNEGP